MTVVAAYQDTPEGRAALDHALVEARLRSTDLVVMTAPAVAGGDPLHSLPFGGSDTANSDGAVPLTVRPAVRPDDLAAEIVDLASSLSADMIVIGMRRRSPVGKLFLGSAAQDVLLNATVPVLAVRASRSA
ncbi:MAG: universal stress protein [Nakamurella sp.]